MSKAAEEKRARLELQAKADFAVKVEEVLAWLRTPEEHWDRREQELVQRLSECQQRLLLLHPRGKPVDRDPLPPMQRIGPRITPMKVATLALPTLTLVRTR